MVNQAQVPLQMEGFAGSKRWNSYDCSTWNFDELCLGWRSEETVEGGSGVWQLKWRVLQLNELCTRFNSFNNNFSSSIVQFELGFHCELCLYLPHLVEVQWTLTLFVAFRGVCWDLVFNICPFARCIVLLAGKVLRKYCEWELSQRKVYDYVCWYT